MQLVFSRSGMIIDNLIIIILLFFIMQSQVMREVGTVYQYKDLYLNQRKLQYTSKSFYKIQFHINLYQST